MVNPSEDFVKILARDKKLKLDHLHEEHRIAIAVYNAKRDILMSDLSILEKQLDKQ